MANITFHGGVKDIGGNKFLVESKGTKVLMDFGMSFTAENKYFSEYLKPRGSNTLTDLIDLGILPKIKGLYRTDYAKHMGFDGDEPTEIDAVLLTHAHVDHCGYIKYLRPDIPIHCSEESYLIMKNFDETGNGEQYLTLKEKFKFHESDRGKTKGQMVKDSRDNEIPRKIEIFKSYKKFKIDSIEVDPLPVDHSISGVHGFVLDTSEGIVANTADLRFHGRRSEDTEKFVEKCSEYSLDLLLCEGTRINNQEKSPTEFNVTEDVIDIINKTENLVIAGYPIRDLDRLQSFYIAAKETGRDLVIELKQAYLLQLFNESENLKGIYPSPTDKHIKIYFPKGSWGLIDKDINVYTRKLLDEDYKSWARPFLDYGNKVYYHDVSEKQKEMLLSLSDFKLQELIDIKPKQNSSYIHSLVEPFNDEMEFAHDRIKNWLVKFGLISSAKKWHQVHVSGHGDGQQIKRVIDETNAKKIIPIHTDPEYEVYHQKWHNNVQPVNLNDSVRL